MVLAVDQIWFWQWIKYLFWTWIWLSNGSWYLGLGGSESTKTSILGLAQCDSNFSSLCLYMKRKCNKYVNHHPWNTVLMMMMIIHGIISLDFFFLFDGNMPKTSSLVVAPERNFQLLWACHGFCGLLDCICVGSNISSENNRWAEK